MKVIRFQEWRNDKVGLFETLNSIIEFEFFQDYPPDELDLLFNLMFDNRVVSSVFHEKSMIETVTVLALRFKGKWNDLYTWFNINHPFNASSVETYSELVKSLDEREISNDKVNMESAYNSNDFVNESKVTDVSNDSGDSSTDKSFTRTRESLQALTIRKSMIEKEVFIDGIFRDIITMICLAVY